MLNRTQQQMKDELLNEINNNGADIDDIKDRSGEWIDGYLPVYYNRILEEWKDMPSEYNDRGAEELGAGEGGIFNLMSLDLYIYYTDLFNEVVEEIEEELADKEEANA